MRTRWSEKVRVQAWLGWSRLARAREGEQRMAEAVSSEPSSVTEDCTSTPDPGLGAGAGGR